MKRYTNKYILIPGLVVLLLAALSSCEKFLEEKQVTNLTQDYYNNEAGLNSLINGLYIYARVKHEWSDNGARLTESETDAYMNVDNTWSRMQADRYGSDASTVALTNVNNYLGAANSNFAPMGAYPHINNCNIALEVIDNVKPGKYGIDEGFRNTRRAEILMLRAWAYYLVSNQLGAVPLLLTAKREDNGIYHYPKESLENVYKQIIGDVRFAFDNLPATTPDRGRVTKWAAGHFLAKMYLNRAQAAQWQGGPEEHLKMLYKGNVTTDLDSSIFFATEVINGKGGAGGLAPDYATLFNPANEGSPHGEIIWSAQFDVNGTLNGRFGGNRSCNYHIGTYLEQSGIARVFEYGRPFATLKPTDWAYDNFHDKVNDSRFYKSFQYEYTGNLANASFTWNDNAAAWWNANKPAGEPTIVKVGSNWPARVQPGKRAIIFVENQKDEALDSTAATSQPFQVLARWIKSSVTNKVYYRKFIDGSDMGLNTARRNIYLSSRKFTDPNRTGTDPNSEAGTRDAILMRLAETFLIRAEAYGRKGDYAMAVQDINVVRKRAAYRNGEARPLALVQWEPQRTTLTAPELLAPYTATGTAVTKMEITEDIFTPGTSAAIAERYISTIGSKDQMFIHFIYNEKGREFLSEGYTWEDQHNAGILYERVVNFNQMASSLTGLWEFGDNPSSGNNGQDGNGKGFMEKRYTFRPWPNSFLVQLTDETGKLLDQAALDEYQNFGY
jgi:starch-binding outer membrane protein, SusD/RagB family